MSEAEVMTAALVPTVRRAVGRGSQTTETEREDIRQAYVFEQLSISEIAKRTGRTRETISGIVRDEETKKLEGEVRDMKRARAKATLAHNVDAAADAWSSSLLVAAKKGDHRPARDLLAHEGVIEPIGHGAGGVTVVIGVGLDQVKFLDKDNNVVE